METLALAFDIERTGTTCVNGDTIAIGACVVDEKFRVLDKFLTLGYNPRDPDAKMEPLRWTSFWVKNQDTLAKLECDDSLPKAQRQERMIRDFHNFRKKWEIKCAKTNRKLALCSDNNVFDGGFINAMMAQYLPDQHPIPFSAVEPQEYAPFWETHAMQRGLLMTVDPLFDSDWGVWDRIQEIYDVPAQGVVADHMPDNDAHDIAFQFQVLRAIQRGVIGRRPNNR